MAHGGKECRQDKIDGGIGSRADAGTRSNEIACVVLRKCVFEQLVVPRRFYRLDATLRLEPHIRDVFRPRPRDDEGNTED
jgi:hypothetical protein